MIILTAKHDNFQFISECIRLGAHDYFLKPQLDPGHFFLHIESAIQQSLQNRKLSSLVESATETNVLKPFLYLGANNFNGQIKGYFAYKLNSVACPAETGKQGSEYLCQAAFMWHTNFLNSVTLHDSDLVLRLRYIFNPGNDLIETIFVFEFDAPQEEIARMRFEELRKEFDVFLQTKSDYNKAVYSFSPVTEEKVLENLLVPFNTENLVQFVPAFTDVTLNLRKQIGFSTSTPDQNEQSMSLPLFARPELSLEHFCEIMVYQKSRTMVEIMLAASKCFNVQVLAAQESKTISKTLLSAVSAVFFGSAANVGAIKVNINKVDILKKSGENNDVRTWINVYSINNILNVFKLPFPFSQTLAGVKSFYPIFGFLPQNVSKTGPVAGSKQVNGQEVPIRLGVEDLRKHLYLLGQTGTGKTTILFSMVMERIYAGKGVCVIDPHGDLHRQILEHIPANRMKDVICFEPGSRDNQVRINLLEYNKENPQEKSFLIDELSNFFRQEYDPNSTMGPIFELFMKNALLLLMDDPDDIGSIGVSQEFDRKMQRPAGG